MMFEYIDMEHVLKIISERSILPQATIFSDERVSDQSMNFVGKASPVKYSVFPYKHKEQYVHFRLIGSERGFMFDVAMFTEGLWRTWLGLALKPDGQEWQWGHDYPNCKDCSEIDARTLLTINLWSYAHESWRTGRWNKDEFRGEIVESISRRLEEPAKSTYLKGLVLELSS